MIDTFSVPLWGSKITNYGKRSSCIILHQFARILNPIDGCLKWFMWSWNWWKSWKPESHLYHHCNHWYHPHSSLIMLIVILIILVIILVIIIMELGVRGAPTQGLVSITATPQKLREGGCGGRVGGGCGRGATLWNKSLDENRQYGDENTLWWWKLKKWNYSSILFDVFFYHD